MLKWTVSRSLSQAGSTPHGPVGAKAARRPFRDLSNTPPAAATTRTSSTRNAESVNLALSESNGNAAEAGRRRSASISAKRTPSKRRRCRSHGSDLKGYFQSSKSSLRSGKRQSLSQRDNGSPVIESFYQSTPRVDADIGPLTLYPCGDDRLRDRQRLHDHLPHRNCGQPRARPSGICFGPNLGALTPTTELPRKLGTGESLAGGLQSHVSDFFQQISMATSPEDVMESESLPFAGRRFPLEEERHQTPRLPKLARIAKLNARSKTPYHTKLGSKRRSTGGNGYGDGSGEFRQTPYLVGKLLGLNIDQGSFVDERTDDTVTDAPSRDREGTSHRGQSVAEILLDDSAERRKILKSGSCESLDSPESRPIPTADDEPATASASSAPTADEATKAVADEGGTAAAHNDSSVSSASQLLENPSPISWAFCSPPSDLEGEFPLRRQRAIRRKRQANNREAEDASSAGKRPKRERLPFLEAVNRHVRRHALETDLDSSTTMDAEGSRDGGGKDAENARKMELDEVDSGIFVSSAAQPSSSDAPSDRRDQPRPSECPTAAAAARCARLARDFGSTTTTATTICGAWDTDSPKSSLIDSFATTTGTCTPETPLVATVRRCLKYSPETPKAGAEYCSRQRGGAGLAAVGRGSIEIECSSQADEVHVKIIRCRDLRRACEGPVHAYVKASVRDPASGEGRVKRTAVHRPTPNPVFNETLVLSCPGAAASLRSECGPEPAARRLALDIAVWHRDRRARRSELLGCMTLPLPLSQDKEATWHPLEVSSVRSSSTVAGYPLQETGTCRTSVVSPALSKDGGDSAGNNNDGGAAGSINGVSGDDLMYLRHLELEPLDPLTGLPLHPGFTARGGRTPCTVTRRLVRPPSNVNQVAWGFSLSWGRPPRVERVDPGSPAERSGLRPGDYVVFIDTTNVVTQPRDDILELIQAATYQLILEVYRRAGHGHAATGTSIGGRSSSLRRPSSVNVSLQAPVVGVMAPGHHHAAIAFTAEFFPNLAADAPPEEELNVRETRYWSCLKSGQARFLGPLNERRDVLSATDHTILFQNLDELLRLSEEIRDEGGSVESYLVRMPRITAAYRRYLGGLQRACCLLAALRKNSAFVKIVCEPAVPRRRKPDLTGVLIQPLEHYREMTRLLCQACPRNCPTMRDLAQGYREATASAGVMEPPRDNGRPLLSLQEVESRLVFARCKPFALAVPGRQWLFGGALVKVEGRGRLQPTWALLLTDLLVFARVSRDRVLFVTEEPLRLACIAEAFFTVRKRPTEFRLQLSTQPSAPGENPTASTTEIVQCAGTLGGGGVGGGCSPHGRPRRRLLILRAPSPELKAVWHNLLQRQIIYVNTGYGAAGDGGESPDDDSPTTLRTNYLNSNGPHQREFNGSPGVYRSAQQLEVEDRSGSSLDLMLKSSDKQDENHLAQWVRNSHQIPPPDHEVPIEEWTPEELAARTPREAAAREFTELTEESTVINSDVEQHSTASSASQSTVKSNSIPLRKNGSIVSSKDTSSGSINICRRCHRSGCPTPPLPRDPFSPLPPKIAVLPPTPDLCSRHRPRNGLYDSPSRNSTCRAISAEAHAEDGSEDDLDCDGEPPYRVLRRFGTMSSLDQDDELEHQTRAAVANEEAGHEIESPPSGLRAWTQRASSYVVSKMALLENFGEGCLLQPPAPPERTESSLDPSNNGDEEGTTSGGTSGDDIWGTPTSGGPDDDSFTGSPPPSSTGAGGTFRASAGGEDNHGCCPDDDEADEPEDSEAEDCALPELSMDQLLDRGPLLGGGGATGPSLGPGSLRAFLGRRRLEPLPEEEDSLSVGSGVGDAQVGWW